MIVWAIIVMAIGCVGTNCWMALNKMEPPQAFTLLTGGLVGSLSTMLVKTSPTNTTPESPKPTLHGTPMPVNVISSETDPVHTEETNKEKET